MEFFGFHPEKMSLLQVQYLDKSSVFFFIFLLDEHPALINNYISEYPAIAGRSIEEVSRIMYAHLRSSILLVQTHRGCPWSYAQFSKPFKHYLRSFGVTDKTAFIGAHYAVAVLLKRDLAKIQWICYHSHGLMSDFLRARRDFSYVKLILTVRDPRAAHLSYLRGWTFPLYMRTVWEVPCRWQIFSNTVPAKDLLVIRHEDLHGQGPRYPTVRRRVCSFLNITNHSSLDDATIFGQLWDGHLGAGTFSRTNLRSSRPNKVYAKQDWKRDLSSFHISFIQSWLKASMRRFHYAPYTRSGPGKATVKPYEDLIRHLFIFLSTRLHDRFITAEGIVRFYTRIKGVAPLRWLFILWLHAAGILFSIQEVGRMYFHYWKYK